jgi:hypothetical protein
MQGEVQLASELRHTHCHGKVSILLTMIFDIVWIKNKGNKELNRKIMCAQNWGEIMKWR